MPYDLRLSQALHRGGWRVKIFDKERLERPHVTIQFKGQRFWRLALRDGNVLDTGDAWGQIDDRVRSAVERAWRVLQQEWDRIHPDNPISSEEDE